MLSAGGIVAYPAETMYGLGGNGLDTRVTESINQIKGRPVDTPLLMLVDNTSEARRLSASWTLDAERLAEKHWPGPLTLIVPAAPAIRSSDGTVAIRVPASEYLRTWVREAGFPLSSTSANRSGESPVRRASEIISRYGPVVDLVVAGPRYERDAPPSTLVDVTGAAPVVVREGAIPAVDCR